MVVRRKGEKVCLLVSTRPRESVKPLMPAFTLAGDTGDFGGREVPPTPSCLVIRKMLEID